MNRMLIPAIALLMLTACGGGTNAVPVIAPTATPQPIVTVAPNAIATPFVPVSQVVTPIIIIVAKTPAPGGYKVHGL